MIMRPAAVIMPALMLALGTTLAQDDANFTLPPYMETMPTSDPRFSSLNESGADYALGQPGDGGVTSYGVAILVKPHDTYRIWGGPASKCGYWWMMAPDDDAIPANMTIGTYTEIYAVICPSWNNATNITRCTLPVGAAVVVGPAQTAKCAAGDGGEGIETLVPAANDTLQLNGDICGTMPDVVCVSCESAPKLMLRSPKTIGLHPCGHASHALRKSSIPLRQSGGT